MESIPIKSRGFVSGLLQSGYPMGYLLAAVVYGLVHDTIGWRGLFFVGVAPALLVLYIRRNIQESKTWQHESKKVTHTGMLPLLIKNWKLSLYLIIIMTAFCFFSHGTQDLYPTFLQVQHQLDTHTVSKIAIVYNIGAIIGGIIFGIFSERFGRRRIIAIAAIIALPIIPLWAFSSTGVLLAIGAFLMQIAVQGAWSGIPAYLNELSPSEIRATFPGLLYQLGNLFASGNTTIQAYIAKNNSMNYGFAMALTVGIVVVIISILILFGPEKRQVDLSV